LLILTYNLKESLKSPIKYLRNIKTIQSLTHQPYICNL